MTISRKAALKSLVSLSEGIQEAVALADKEIIQCEQQLRSAGACVQSYMDHEINNVIIAWKLHDENWGITAGDCPILESTPITRIKVARKLDELVACVFQAHSKHVAP